MRKIIGLAIVAGLGFGSFAVAQSADHIVSINIAAISQLSVSTDVSLAIDGSTPVDTFDGNESFYASNSSAELSWTTNQGPLNIDVSTEGPPPEYELLVSCDDNGNVDVFEGGEVIDGVGNSVGSCALEYTLRAPLTASVQTATHTVTYTLTGN